ncbi:MAG: glycosyltransferase family 39 protein [Thermoflexales bacterium]|nr:glycosyltransferase family 39 protein [Thermoflexales bacterium]
MSSSKPNSRSSAGSIVSPLLLIVIVAVAAYFRFSKLDWDEGQHLHPDERFLTMVETAIQPIGAPVERLGTPPVGRQKLRDCTAWGGYFDTACSPLNPVNRGHGYYVYGTLPIFLVRYIGEAIDQTDYGEIHLLGRGLSGLADIVTLLLLFATARRLYDEKVALLASALFAAAALPIQQSHYFTVDNFAVMFSAATFYFAVRAQQEGKWLDFAAAGVLLGTAVACKISVWPLAGIVTLATFLWWTGGPRRPLESALFKLALAALLAMLAFRTFQPYAFAGPNFWDIKLDPGWRTTMESIQKLINGEQDAPYAHQWAYRAPVIFSWLNMVVWGMGLPLGLAAWAGWAFVGWQIARKRQSNESDGHQALWRTHLLPWLWATIFFIYQSTQWTKSIRYQLPVYPMFVMFAAYLAVTIKYQISNRNLRNVVAGVVTASVLVGALGWGWGLTRIYARSVTRVTASRWIYQNVPAGTALGNEHWDDGIPLRVDGRDGFLIYRGIEFQNYNEDDANKLPSLISWLSQADYINLTSNRLYSGIPRLPTRYPMTSEYYRALISGELGFEKVAEFSSYITIGPFEFPDQESTEMLGMPNPFDRSSGYIPIFLPPAEEAFSVYDHPRVLIYRKTADFSPEKVAQVLGDFDPEQRVVMLPKQATEAPTALMLEDDAWATQQQSGTWSALYDRNSLLNRYPGLAILAWWLLLSLLGILAWPVIAFAWPGLPDRGWGLARTLGLLVVAYLAWLAASLRVMTFGRGTLLAAAGILVALGLGSAVMLGGRQDSRLRFTNYLSRHWPILLVEELVFAATFALFLLIRYGNGDLWHFYMGGERPMDFAYLNAVLKSVSFPPYDPWFAGGQMNYYYFGFVLVSVPIKLLGTVPALAYNIALPMLAALTAVGAFSVAFNVFQVAGLKLKVLSQEGGKHQASSVKNGVWVGLLAAMFVVLMGNLGELKLIMDALAELGHSDFRSTIPGLAYTASWIRGFGEMIGGRALPVRLEWWYWNASRLIPNGEINEFPFFTFLYSDLHAHMIAFPLTVLMLGIGLGWALRRQWRSFDAAFSLLVGGIVVGVARANNTWDYPTYLALAFIGLFASGLNARPAPPSPAKRVRTLQLAQALLSGALGLALFGAAWVMGGIDDVPTFGFVAILLFTTGQLMHRLLEDHTGPNAWRWIDAAYIAVMGVSILYYHPYTTHYATAYSNAELWKGTRTPPNLYLLIHGIFLFPIATYLVVELRRLGWRWFAAAAAASGIWRETIAFLAILVSLAGVAVAALGYGVILVAGPLMVAVALLLIRPRLPAAQRYILLLLLLALLISFAVEVIVLRGDIGRMNTIFKFYLQVWIILGIAAAVLIGWLSQYAARRWSPDTWTVWQVAMAALVVAGLSYTLFATRAKLQDRFDASLGPTLNAMEFMTVAHANEQGQDYSFADEYEALLWMQDNVQGTPVVAESAAAPEYRSLRNRVSTYTGLPSIIGYNWHQKQQRSILVQAVVDQRAADTNELYNTVEAGRAMQLIRQYDVRYVMAGYPERLYYPPQGLIKFDTMVQAGQLRVAFANDGVTIYEVKDQTSEVSETSEVYSSEVR